MRVITSDIEENEAYLRELYQDCSDIIFRSFETGTLCRQKCLIIFADGLCDKTLICDSMLKTIMNSAYRGGLRIKRSVNLEFGENNIPVPEISFEEEFEKLTETVFSGDCAILIDGESSFMKVSARAFKSRGFQEAESKTVIRGPRDAFTENFRDNTMLIRRRLKNPKFKIVMTNLGDETKTAIGICYMEGIAQEGLVALVQERLAQVQLKSVLESGFIEKELEKVSPSLFPQVQSTERPDEASAALLEGRVVIITDNTPFVLILPGLLKSQLTTPADFYETKSKKIAFFVLRVFAMVFTILLPAMYIAIVEYNPEFISDKLILFITHSRKFVPFPSFIEILFMQFIFEVILEAAIRLPKQIGFTVGIVGSLVVGQAIVDASLVNIMVVIVVALNATLAFVIPSWSLVTTVRFLRILFMVVASLLGFFGITLAFLAVLIHLSELHLFDIEFLYPFVDSPNVLKKIEKEENFN